MVYHPLQDSCAFNIKAAGFSLFLFGLFIFLGPGCSPKEEFKVLSQGQPPRAAVAAAQEAPQAAKETPQEPAVARPQEKEEQFNPFLTQKEEDALVDIGTRVSIDYLVLSAIVYSPLDSRAVINNRILRKGDSIDDKEIIEILPESVILKDAQSEYSLALKKIAAK